MKRLVVALLALSLSMALAAPAEARVYDNEIIPLSGLEVFIPCTGDTVTLQGSMHVLAASTITDRLVSTTTHFQLVDVSGVDTTGRTYRGVGLTRDHLTNSFVNDLFVFTIVNNFSIVGTSGAASYMVHVVLHDTINPQGGFTANILRIRVTCQ